jgi:hypothetical protein
MKIDVLKLRPTQIAVGMHEVDVKVEKLQQMKSSEREKYVKKHKVPAVLGPRGRVYIVDHHHLARACWEVGEKTMWVEVVEDFSKLTYPEFWKRLERNHWLHLYDQYGRGPFRPEDLPPNVRCLADDPYRSLVWEARERGACSKVNVPYSEFTWAQFLRTNVKHHPIFDGWELALAEALLLAKSPEAKALPGFLELQPA